MLPTDDTALTAYDRFEILANALGCVTVDAERSTILCLALRSALHPSLEPFRQDPLLPLEGRFVSLDAQIAGMTARIRNQTKASAAIGSIGGTLYLPATQSVSVCRVHVAYLASQPVARWEQPIAVHPVSADLQNSAQKALDTALYLLLFVCPSDNPPAPSQLFWGIESIEDAILGSTAGDSLQLPLTLAFLSALSGLPVESHTGATGAVRSPERIGAVGFVEAKREAFLSRQESGALFLTPNDGGNIQEIALKMGDSWRKRFARPRKSNVFFLPPGTKPTFLYAEIENTPVFWANYPSRFRTALLLYETILADSVERHGGKIFSPGTGTGESSGAVFGDPAQATNAAVHLLRCVRAALWDEVFGDSLPVRIGIHSGDGEPAGENWRGIGPAQALRIASAASAYQILTSDAVHVALNPADWVNHGNHRLRDLSNTVRLWQVTAPGIQTISVPPESLDTRPNNLPALSSPIIGRGTEINSLVGLLANERFLILTGAGGVGKTRLALAVAARAMFAQETASRFSDGAFYVSLDAGSRDEQTVTDAICEAIGVTKIASISTKRLLLVLDNAEGVANIVAKIATSLWNHAPGVVFLVTSRIPIRFYGEKRFRVLPLAVPRRDADEETWGQTASVQLFLERAKTINNGFVITTQIARDTMSRLLRRLDGLPLAIELAAARTRYLSISEIESRLVDSLRLLSTREVDIPERQRTLLATLEWSYSLLSKSEQRLLQRVSVFVGGFGADAAEGIMEQDPDTLDLLASLEEQSLLVVQRADKGEPPRFSLLQTVSDFAGRKRKEAEGESNTARKIHTHYYTQFAERHGGEKITLSPRETEAFDTLDRDMANLRATWSYLRETNDIERLAKFAVNLSDFLRRRGHARERLDWIETALNCLQEGELRRQLLYAQAMTLRDTGRTAEAVTVAESLQSLVEQGNDGVRIADVLALRGSIATRAKQFEEAERFFDDAEVLYQAEKHLRGIATVSSNRAVNALRMGETERSRELSEFALRQYHDIGDEQGKAYAHNNLGYLRSEAGEYDVAKGHYLHQLNYCRANADTIGCAVSLFNIGEALLHLDLGNGLPLLIAAAEMFSRVGHPYAGAASSDCEKWSDKTNTAQSVFAALRCAASRRTLAELRDISIG